MSGFIRKPATDQRKFLAVMRAQMFARLDIELRQPVVRDVATPGAAILGNVARDIRQLEGKAKVETNVTRATPDGVKEAAPVTSADDANKNK